MAELDKKAVNHEDLAAYHDQLMQSEMSQKADKDGNYPDLVAGNLVGAISQEATFAYRRSAGSIDIDASGNATPGASLQGIKGNSVAWNQLVRNGNFAGGANYFMASNGSLSASNGILSYTVATVGEYNYHNNVNWDSKVIEGHKYYILVEINPAHTKPIACFAIGVSQNPSVTIGTVTAGEWNRKGAILGADYPFNPGLSEVQIALCTTAGYGYSVGDIDQLRSIQLFDLTLIYGSGNEPVTPEAFEADYLEWYGKPLGYEDYDAGSLRPVRMAGLKTVGFNQFDGQWPTESFTNNCSYTVSGDEITMIVSGDDPYIGLQKSVGYPYDNSYGPLVRVLPNTTYHFHATNNIFAGNYLTGYNKEKICIAPFTEVGYGYADFDFTTPADCYYITLRIGTGSGISSGSYTTKICINLSHSGRRNGEYEPYWESLLNVPVTTMKGRKDGTGSPVVVFPDGLKKAGTVYDEVVKRGSQTIGIKRVGSVDLGSLTWGLDGDNIFGSLPISDYIFIDDFTINYLCSIYISIAHVARYVNKAVFLNEQKRVIIKDGSYSDTVTFKSAMSGVMLYYELATPEEYVLDDFELPQSYYVDAWGTEEVVAPTGQVTIAPTLSMEYGMNAPDAIRNLPRNYVSAHEQQTFTEAQKARARKNIGTDSVYAQKKGYYPDLHVGLADSLFGETQTNDMFTFRPTAGIQDIESGEPPLGGASVKRIEGNAVAWNQLVQNGNFADGTTGWNSLGFSTFSVSNGELTLTKVAGLWSGLYEFVPLVTDHKYYTRLDAKIVMENGFLGLFLTDGEQNYVDIGAFSSTDYNTFKSITTFSSIGDRFYILARGNESAGEFCKIKDFYLIDLTLIFGSGNEPETVAEFESWLSQNIGKKDYYPYNAGELIPVKDFKVKSVGFNAWDEEMELGYYDVENGAFGSRNDGLCSKRGHKYKVIPNTTYHVTLLDGNGASATILFFDSDDNYLGYSTRRNAEMVTPSNADYFVFYLNAYGTTYNHDICISLSYDDDKDGTYEEHWEHETAIDVTTLKGKLNGTGDSVVVFPDGLKSAGTVHDEIVKAGDVTKAIKRIGAVDLGTLTWIYNLSTVYNEFSAEINGKFSPGNPNPNVACSFYPIETNVYYDKMSDKMLVYADKAYNDTDTYVTVKDSAYTNAATFKTAMSGVMLYYELATPEEYIIDDALLPVKYAVDDYGTEELLLGNDTEVVSVAPTMTIKYGINAADTIASLPHNYVSSKYQSLNDEEKKTARNNIGAASQKDMIVVKKQLELIDKKVENDYYVDMGLPSGLLWAKRNIDLSQADKFAPSEFSYDASFFSWGNTDGHNPTGDTFDYDFGASNDGPYASTPGAKLTGNISPSYDAAHVNLGEPWRMPTTEEFQELFDNCDFIDANGDVIPSTTTNKLVTMSGVVGIRLKSKINGRILFFPCCGYGFVTIWDKRGFYGNYWSGSLYSSVEGHRFIFFDITFDPQSHVGRFYGFVIRPVM